ncbi:Peptidoglycan/LPS O-acetylase OafA/YrhL, contains acyltransferase and SGNH-hydrolase domains [Bradyrhizobium lablabi]|uniref:Peptidoglycan/LPS O-acetylase OafA/YrhL, contains acyltransferase and SGNH-hydrolase domains n=1 Tax=Bradyrhizobium lablabi TaxID=722472 RepID=A0A1M7B151_9BRAD|nr:acyltransferase [Bradyrhizobium lablabi]SHL48732.1 Peptidoglycan/LPS O-acetylase OafA/YrhL, contains acyltransferase and SGNH-hydrolase domains [Bradyrhizobium lablabi]
MAAEIRSLTGVRGIGAALIVIYHFGKIRLDWINPIWPIPHGYMAVDLFFMLSGFVIGLGYRNAFAEQFSKNYGAFLIKRVARLYPAYIAISILYVLKLAFGLAGEETLSRFGRYDVIGNLLMLGGWGLHIYPLIGVAWAASAELGSYILLPLLMKGTLQRGIISWSFCVLASIFAIYAIAVSGLGYSGPLDVVETTSLYPLLRAVAGFTFGLATYRYAENLDRLTAKSQDAFLIVTLVALVVAACATTNDFPVYFLLIPLIAILSRDGRLALLLFGNKLVYHLGVISYSIYLLHPLFIRFTALSSRHFGATPLAYTICSLVSFVVIWGLSYLSYRFVEIPGRNLITGLLLAKRDGAVTAPAPSSPTG